MKATHATLWCLLGAAVSQAAPVAAGDVRVTVVAIHASDRNKDIDDELKEIAEKVSKVEPTLTGFRKGRTTTIAIPIGGKDNFPLVDGEVATVTVESPDRKDPDKVRLTVKPPTVGAITYKTATDRFFPIVTRYTTKNNERLIIAVMVERK